MATPPDQPGKHGKKGPDTGTKRRPTEPFAPGSGANDATTAMPAYSDDVTTTTPAVSDDLLGSGRLDAGRSEPSEPNAVIGPITKRRSRTSPYVAASELKLEGPDAEPPPKPKKKSLPRRMLKWFAWTVVTLLLLIGATLAFFHTGPGKSVAKGLVESALNKRYDGKVTVGELDYAIGGDVEIKDLIIAEHGGREVVHLKSLLLQLDWGSLLSKPLTVERLVIAGLDLDLVTFPDGSSNLRRMQKEPTKLPDQIVLQALEVSGVNVSIERPDGQTMKVTDLALAARVALDNPAETLDFALTNLQGKLESPNADATFQLAASVRRQGRDIEGSLEPKQLSVKSPRLGEAPLAIVIQPIKVSMKDGAAELTFGGLQAGPLTIAGMRTLGRLPPPGQLGLGPGEHLLELTGLKVDHLGLNKLLGRDVLVSDIGVDASVKGPAEALAVNGQVTTDGGRIGLTGTIDARDMLTPIVHLVLEGSDLDTTRILAGEQRPDVQTAFKATLDLKGLPPAHTLKLHADVAKTTVRGRSIDAVVIDLSGQGDLITLDGLELTAFGQTLKVDGEFDRASREFRVAVHADPVLGEALQRARDAGVLITPLPGIEGVLDIDLGVQGKLKPAPALADGAVPGVAPAPATPFDPKALIVNGRIDLSTLPIEHLTMKGEISAKDVVVKGSPESGLPDKTIGLVDIDVDLKVEGGKPDGIDGLLVAKVGALDTGTTTLDEAEVRVVLHGLRQDITITAKDEKQALALDVAMNSLLDLEKRHVDTTITRLDVKRGPAETHLEAPVTLAIDSGPDGKQSLRLPPMKLALAGGTLDVAVAARLSKDEANPGATKVDHFDVALDLDAVDVGKLAALAKRPTRGLSGKLDASVRAQGTKENPQLDFFGSLRGRIKSGAPFTAKFDGGLRNKTLDLELNVLDRESKSPLFTLDVLAPLNLPTTPGGKPSLGAGRFAIEAELPETTLATLGALMPDGLPPTLDPEATIGFGLALSGTTTRPTGDWHLDFSGDMLRRRGYDKAPARQKVALQGQLRSADGQVSLDNDLDFHLDAGAPAYLAHHTHGTFARSPLLRGFMDKPWTLTAGLEKPLDLAALHALGLAQKPLLGTLTTTAELRGQGADVLGTLGLTLAGVKYGTAPVANVDGLVTIGERDIHIHQNVMAAGLDALVVDARVGVPGKGLRTADRARLMRAPLSGEIRLVEHLVAAWKEALDGVAKVPDLPGKVGGALTLGGDLQTPTANGAFAWDGFDTVAGEPGRIAFELDVGAERAAGGLAIGAQREIVIGGGVDRAELKPPAPGVVPGPLPIELAMKADQVDLLRVVPAFAAAGKPWKIKGMLDWHMNGTVYSSRDPALPGLTAGSHLLGDLIVSALDVEIPDTDRHIENGRIAFTATREALEIAGIELHEGRFPNLVGFTPPATDEGDRFVSIRGRVPWTDLKVTEASLEVKAHDWLVLGQGFDGPEGELDIAMRVHARDLLAPVKAIDVTIDALELYSPDRFIRAHYPQFPAYDDLIYLDQSDRPSGRLPPGKGSVVATTDPSGTGLPPVPAAPPPDPNAGFDVKLAIPNEIHVIFAAASPLEIRLKGAMDVHKRGDDLTLKGRLDLTDGVLGAMGRDFQLIEGAIVADGGLDSAKADIVFGIRPHDIALRDIAAGQHHDLATITLHASAKTGLVTTFGGVSGPYLLDMATLLNTGRARLWGLPDVPTSGTVRFGNPDQGLVLTFIQTNLRNLIFMDRMNGWSESLEEPAEYGRLRFFDMQRFVDGARVHFLAQPPEIGQNRMELGYDWLLIDGSHTVLGFGPHLGTDLRLGLGFSLEWSSKN